MTKRIFRSICAVAAFVFIASVIIIMSILHNYYTEVHKDQLIEQLELASRGVEMSGEEFLEGLHPEGYRLTLISSDGSVLYDSDSSVANMENHLEREEVKEAIEKGRGESSRFSTTMTEEQLYESMKLSNGDILRVSAHQQTLFGLFVGISQSFIIIIGLAILLALLLAYRLTKYIIKPLNDIDITGKTDAEYDEIQPLIDRIKIQKNKIEIQKDKLRHKELEFETLTRNMDDGLILADVTGHVIFANQSAERILGTDLRSDESSLDESTDYYRFSDMVEKALGGSHTERNVNIKGKEYTIHCDLVDSDNKVHGIAILIIDLSWREKAEMIRREFTANVAHELKTPLQTISGSSELMCAGLVKDDDIKEFSEKIYDESKRLIALVDDITGLSQLDEGQYDHTREEIDLYNEADKTIEELKTASEKAGVELVLEGEHVVISGIRRLVHSIIYNLVDNSIKYSKADGKTIVSIRKEGSRAILSVKDNGIGIPEEEQERIFERFYRVDKSRSKEVGGTGLGLSIVKHAAQIHNAEVDIESEIGGGTTITVGFPA